VARIRDHIRWVRIHISADRHQLRDVVDVAAASLRVALLEIELPGVFRLGVLVQS